MIKKISNFFVTLFAFAIMFVGCADLDLNSTYVDNKNSEKAILTIDIKGDTLAARTVLPNAWDGAALFYKIEGKSARGNTLTPTKPTVEGAKLKIALEYDKWELTLTAYKDEECTLPVLKGYGTGDLTNGASEISFELKPYDITTVGTLNLGGTYTDSEGTVKKYRMALIDYETGEELTTPAAVEGTKSPFAFGTFNDIAPGTYLFEIRFYNGEEIASAKQIGYYSDLVIVDPGNTTEKTDIAIGDIIMKKPSSPTNLKAFRVENSDDGDYYNVKLTWDDNSTNEENFVLTIREYDSTGTEIDFDAVADGIQPYAVLGDDFWTSNVRVSGSLLPSNEECVIKLPTGRLFEIEIAAENAVGLSDSDDAIDGDQPCARVDASSDILAGHEGYDATNKIARTKITYNLDGGTLKFASTTYNGTYTEYKTYEGGNINLITPDTTGDPDYVPTDDAPSLIKNDQPFQKWVAEDGEGTRAGVDGDDATKVIATIGFANLVVTANYNATYIINYTIPGHEDLAENRVTATSDAGDCINGTVDVEAGNKDIEFTLTATETDKPTYSSLTVKMTSASGLVRTLSDVTVSGNEFTCTINTVELDSGLYTVNVIAHDAEANQDYSYTFGITVSR
ncbi:MAG: hypothetical protein J6J11_01440 [Treponema sp.]|nr:hypothetical protein [Treponema sp.]